MQKKLCIKEMPWYFEQIVTRNQITRTNKKMSLLRLRPAQGFALQNPFLLNRKFLLFNKNTSWGSHSGGVENVACNNPPEAENLALRDSLFHYKFAEKICRRYLDIIEYDEFFANLVFFDHFPQRVAQPEIRIDQTVISKAADRIVSLRWYRKYINFVSDPGLYRRFYSMIHSLVNRNLYLVNDPVIYPDSCLPIDPGLHQKTDSAHDASVYWDYDSAVHSGMRREYHSVSNPVLQQNPDLLTHIAMYRNFYSYHRNMHSARDLLLSGDICSAAGKATNREFHLTNLKNIKFLIHSHRVIVSDARKEIDGVAVAAAGFSDAAAEQPGKQMCQLLSIRCTRHTLSHADMYFAKELLSAQNTWFVGEEVTNWEYGPVTNKHSYRNVQFAKELLLFQNTRFAGDKVMNWEYGLAANKHSHRNMQFAKELLLFQNTRFAGDKVMNWEYGLAANMYSYRNMQFVKKLLLFQNTRFAGDKVTNREYGLAANKHSYRNMQFVQELLLSQNTRFAGDKVTNWEYGLAANKHSYRKMQFAKELLLFQNGRFAGDKVTNREYHPAANMYSYRNMQFVKELLLSQNPFSVGNEVMNREYHPAANKHSYRKMQFVKELLLFQNPFSVGNEKMNRDIHLINNVVLCKNIHSIIHLLMNQHFQRVMDSVLRWGLYSDFYQRFDGKRRNYNILNDVRGYQILLTNMVMRWMGVYQSDVYHHTVKGSFKDSFKDSLDGSGEVQGAVRKTVQFLSQEMRKESIFQSRKILFRMDSQRIPWKVGILQDQSISQSGFYQKKPGKYLNGKNRNLREAENTAVSLSASQSIFNEKNRNLRGAENSSFYSSMTQSIFYGQNRNLQEPENTVIYLSAFQSIFYEKNRDLRRAENSGVYSSMTWSIFNGKSRNLQEPENSAVSLSAPQNISYGQNRNLSGSENSFVYTSVYRNVSFGNDINLPKLEKSIIYSNMLQSISYGKNIILRVLENPAVSLSASHNISYGKNRNLRRVENSSVYINMPQSVFYRIGNSYSIKTLRGDRTPAEWKMLLAATRRRRRISLCKVLFSEKNRNLRRSENFSVYIINMLQNLSSGKNIDLQRNKCQDNDFVVALHGKYPMVSGATNIKFLIHPPRITVSDIKKEVGGLAVAATGFSDAVVKQIDIAFFHRNPGLGSLGKAVSGYEWRYQFAMKKYNQIPQKDRRQDGMAGFVSNRQSDLWRYNHHVRVRDLNSEQKTVEKDFSSGERVYARINRAKDGLSAEAQRQIWHSIQQLQDEVVYERQGNAGEEETLEILERKMQQQEIQIEELKKMYLELFQKQEDRSSPLQQERYSALFNNDLKLEQMRYGIS